LSSDPARHFDRAGSPRQLGPFSKRLSFAQLDLRTAQGKFADEIRLALSDQLGGNPSPAQQLMIQAAALKALRVELLIRRVLSEDSIKSNNDNHCLAWLNGLRRDLEALGLLGPDQGRPLPSLDAHFRALAAADSEAA
jgi:hypothetical protein